MSAVQQFTSAEGQRPRPLPQKFSGDAFYAFHSATKPNVYVVRCCCLADDGFIEVADGRDRPWDYRFLPEAFDFCCFGKAQTTEEVEAEVAMLREKGMVR